MGIWGMMSCVFSRLGCDAEHDPEWRASPRLWGEVKATSPQATAPQPSLAAQGHCSAV